MTNDANVSLGEDANKRPEPLGIGATLAWAVLVFVIAQCVAIFCALLVYDLSSLVTVRYDDPLLVVMTLITNPVMIALLVAVTRLRGFNSTEYLGLTRFSP